MRRPSKRHGVQVQGQGQDAYACCPRDELGGQTASSGRTQGPTQSYATLRGRKWVDKQRQNGCASGKIILSLCSLDLKTKEPGARSKIGDFIWKWGYADISLESRCNI